MCALIGFAWNGLPVQADPKERLWVGHACDGVVLKIKAWRRNDRHGQDGLMFRSMPLGPLVVSSLASKLLQTAAVVVALRVLNPAVFEAVPACTAAQSWCLWVATYILRIYICICFVVCMLIVLSFRRWC